MPLLLWSEEPLFFVGYHKPMSIGIIKELYSHCTTSFLKLYDFVCLDTPDKALETPIL